MNKINELPKYLINSWDNQHNQSMDRLEKEAKAATIKFWWYFALLMSTTIIGACFIAFLIATFAVVEHDLLLSHALFIILFCLAVITLPTWKILHYSIPSNNRPLQHFDQNRYEFKEQLQKLRSLLLSNEDAIENPTRLWQALRAHATHAKLAREELESVRGDNSKTIEELGIALNVDASAQQKINELWQICTEYFGLFKEKSKKDLFKD